MDDELKSEWPGRIVATFLFGWIFLLTGLAPYFEWLIIDVVGDVPAGTKFIVQLITGALIFSPAAVLARFWPAPAYRAIFTTWALAAGFILLLASVQWLDNIAANGAALLQIGLCLLYTALVGWWAKARKGSGSRSGHPLLALILASTLALPWLWRGTFGSPLDILLNLLVSLAFGAAVATTLTGYLWPQWETAARSTRYTFLLGLVVGTTLLLMASALNYNNMGLFLLLTLPGLGWAIVVIGRDRLTVTLLVGLSTAATLLLYDAREMGSALMAGLFNLFGFAYTAAILTMVIGWLWGGVLLLCRWLANRGRLKMPGRSILVGGVILSWLLTGSFYLLAGQPGFYGEELFVILESQADLSAANGIVDPAGRRQFVYQTLVSHANTTQTTLRQDLDKWGIDYTPYYLVNGLRVKGGPFLRWWLATRPEVDRVLLNPTLRPLPPAGGLPYPPETAPTQPDWNLTLIEADRVWAELGITGRDITIGQSDSGVQWDHPELLDSYRGQNGNHNYNWFDPWYHTPAPTDHDGHGTHTLGSVLGNGVGVAPDATWFACANLARNLGNPAFYLDCMQFMLAPWPLDGDPLRDGDPAQGANVLNNSWGCPEVEGCDPNALLAGVRALQAAGIFVVASAGNDGPDCQSLEYPIALYQESFSVGAIDQFGQLAEFSSRGPVTADGSNRTKPDIVAPGVSVLSAFPGNSYGRADGTSMAGPHVAGVVALIWSANPALIGDIAQTRQILIETAQPYTGDYPTCLTNTSTPNNAVGYGMVNAYAAVQMALEFGR